MAGAMQRLVHLLDCGSDSRITEICAKTLANLGSQPNNRTFIRLAGGIPPLVSLLFDQSSPAVRLEPTSEGSPSLPTGNYHPPAFYHAWPPPPLQLHAVSIFLYTACR